VYNPLVQLLCSSCPAGCPSAVTLEGVTRRLATSSRRQALEVQEKVFACGMEKFGNQVERAERCGNRLQPTACTVPPVHGLHAIHVNHAHALTCCTCLCVLEPARVLALAATLEHKHHATTCGCPLKWHRQQQREHRRGGRTARARLQVTTFTAHVARQSALWHHAQHCLARV
jgi:hypothetical protein